MDVDPIASMRIWSIQFELGGEGFEIPPLPASDWLPVLMSGDLMDVLDLEPSLDGVDKLLIDGTVSADQVAKALTSVIEQVTGRSIHASLVLSHVAKLKWPLVGGDLARRGMRWDQVSIGTALDAIYSTLMAHLNREGSEKFQAILDNEVSVSRGKVRPNRAKAMSDFENMAGPKPDPGLQGNPQKSNAERSGDEPPRTPTPRQRPPQNDR